MDECTREQDWYIISFYFGFEARNETRTLKAIFSNYKINVHLVSFGSESVTAVLMPKRTNRTDFLSD